MILDRLLVLEKKISMWFNTWLGEEPLINTFGHTDYITSHLHMTVKELILDNEWNISYEVQPYINSSLPAISGEDDKMVWCDDLKGHFTTSSATNKIRHIKPVLHWPSKIWKPFMHPSITSNIWKLIQGIFVDDVKRVKQGYYMVSKCCICKQSQDSMEHLLWSCNFSKSIWQWLGNIFHFNNPISFDDVFNFAKHKSPIIKEVWLTTACATLRELWFQKNKMFFENVQPNLNRFKSRIISLVHYGGYKMQGVRWHQDYDYQILQYFNVPGKYNTSNTIKESFWYGPAEGVVLFCCDGAAFGNPGNAWFGIITRSHDCQVLGTISGGLVVTTNYIAEVMAVVCAIEWAITLSCRNILINSDSQSVVTDFKSGNIPLFIKARWLRACQYLYEILYIHCYREINFSADSLAKEGARLNLGERIQHAGRPSSLSNIEMPDTIYYRFC
ncbi:uncharacterized protein LOC113360563 [Papaver somniferum]|uniref:uncharacterized protein LOC113360563 n=1 Tax=Papaver somniferum TaxID=3469 RepID=UPI000E6F7228|nr:uncharacterized protein LOC113360563 [Papaver somniferum]